MKKLFLLFAAFLTFNWATAQSFDPVSWTFDKIQLENGDYQLNFTAEIEEGWVIFSQFIGKGGPVPTSFHFEATENIDLIDEHPKEISPYKREGFHPIFEINLIEYRKEVTFQQNIKLKTPTSPIVGHLRFMVYNYRVGYFLQPMVIDFEFC